MPTLAASYSVNSAARDTSTLTSATFTPSAGDVIVVKAASEGATAPTLGTASGGGQTFTRVAYSNAANNCEVGIYTATVSGSPGSMAVSLTFTTNVGWHSMVVEHWTSATLAATPATNATKTGSGQPSATVTTTAANSAVTWVNGDWNATAPGTPAYRSSATQNGIHNVSPTNYVAYYATQTAASAGAQTIGMTAPSGQIWSMVGIEVKHASTGTTVTPSGIATTVALGAAVLAAVASPPSIAPTTQFGTASVVQAVTPAGVASTEAFGGPVLTTGSSQVVQPSGVGATAAFGTPEFLGGFGSTQTILAQNGPPAADTSSDHASINLGMRFQASVQGRLTGVKWYCPSGWDGSAGTVWATAHAVTGGAILAQKSLASPVAGQYNDILFDSPPVLDAATDYVVSVYLPTRTAGGDYAYTGGAFASPVTTGLLTGYEGRYDYSSSQNTLPSNTATTWYGVDVLWQPSSVPPSSVEPGGIPGAGAFGAAEIITGPRAITPSWPGPTSSVGVPVLTQGGPPAGWPNAGNTGPRAGTTFTVYSGSNSLTGTLYERVRFSVPTAGYYQATANGAVFRDCIFDAGVVFFGDNLLIERCEIVGGASFSGTMNVKMLSSRVRTTNGDLTHITSDTGQCGNILFQDCLIDDPRPAAGDHQDGLQVRGVQGLTLRHCAIDLGPWQRVNGADVLNSAVFLQNAQGGNSNVCIDDCYLNGGGYILTSDVVSGFFVITSNAFGPDGNYGTAVLTGATPTLAHGNYMHQAGGQAAGIPTVAGVLVDLDPSFNSTGFGTATIPGASAGNILPVGLSSTANVGTPTASRGAVTLQPSGRASAALLGASAVVGQTSTGNVLNPPGRASTVQFGLTTVTPEVIPVVRWRLVAPLVREEFVVRGALRVSMSRQATVFGDESGLHISSDGTVQSGGDEWGAIPHGTRYIWFGGHDNVTDDPAIKDLWLANGFEVENVLS